jgi:hypothetical protein
LGGEAKLSTSWMWRNVIWYKFAGFLDKPTAAIYSYWYSYFHTLKTEAAQ